MGQDNPEPGWQYNWIKPRFLWNTQAVKPAEIGDGLCKAMIAPKNTLEDANYNKILPNQYMIELSPKNYASNFEPIANNLIQQWRDRLLEHLLTTNSRIGRKEYRFGGPLQIDLRTAPDVKENQARILCRVKPDLEPVDRFDSQKTKAVKEEVAFLEMINGDRRWSLYPGDNTIGRDEDNDIFLDLMKIQNVRLVSAHHATIRIEDKQYLLFDGIPGGKPSANGTYLNAQRIDESGVRLQDGDIIILAALKPGDPRLDTPGVAAFRFEKLPLDISVT
jgi:hypothetical protein